MNPKIFVIVGGVFNLSWAIFHVYFPKFFKWDKALKKIDPINRAVMHIQSIFLLITFLIFSSAAFLFTDELISTNLGKYLIASFGIFWFIRSLVNIYFFGIKDKKADFFLLIFIFGFVIHLIPFIIVF